MLVGFSQDKKAEIVKTLDVWLSPVTYLFLKDRDGWRAPNGLTIEVNCVNGPHMNTKDSIHFGEKSGLQRLGNELATNFTRIKEALIALADLANFVPDGMDGMDGMTMYPAVSANTSASALGKLVGFLETEKPTISYDTHIFLSGRVFDFIGTQNNGGFEGTWKARNGFSIGIGAAWSMGENLVIIPRFAQDKITHLEKKCPKLVSHYDRFNVALVELAAATREWEKSLLAENSKMTFY